MAESGKAAKSKTPRDKTAEVKSSTPRKKTIEAQPKTPCEKTAEVNDITPRERTAESKNSTPRDNTVEAIAKTPISKSVKPYNFEVPAHLFTTETVTIEGPKGSAVGVRLNSGLVVLHVERESVSDTHLQFADVLMEFNGKCLNDKKMFVEMLKKHVIETPKDHFKVELKVMRPVCTVPLDKDRMPKGWEPAQGMKYRVGVIHMITGCKLSLLVKSLYNKVYVTSVSEETLTAMALQIGDVIVDVNRLLVSSVNEARDILFLHLKESGYVTLLIETPDDPVTKQIVRTALLTEHLTEIDIPLAPDVVDMCRRELQRFNANPDLKPKKSIFREPKKAPTPRPNSSRLKIHEQTEEIPVACETNPKLLINVPLLPAFNYQPLTEFKDSPAKK